jgi:hypothetical protein
MLSQTGMAARSIERTKETRCVMDRVLRGRLDGQDVEPPVCVVHIGSGTQPAVHPMGEGAFSPGVKRNQVQYTNICTPVRFEVLTAVTMNNVVLWLL